MLLHRIWNCRSVLLLPLLTESDVIHFVPTSLIRLWRGTLSDEHLIWLYLYRNLHLLVYQSTLLASTESSWTTFCKLQCCILKLLYVRLKVAFYFFLVCEAVFFSLQIWFYCTTLFRWHLGVNKTFKKINEIGNIVFQILHGLILQPHLNNCLLVMFCTEHKGMT